jgi:hypothetical protein
MMDWQGRISDRGCLGCSPGRDPIKRRGPSLSACRVHATLQSLSHRDTDTLYPALLQLQPPPSTSLPLPIYPPGSSSSCRPPAGQLVSRPRPEAGAPPLPLARRPDPDRRSTAATTSLSSRRSALPPSTFALVPTRTR